MLLVFAMICWQTNFSQNWGMPINHWQQFNSGWNCNVITPPGYHYLGWNTINGNYYANYSHQGVHYRQQIGLNVASVILNIGASIVNNLQGNQFGWNQWGNPGWNNGNWQQNWNQWNNPGWNNWNQWGRRW